jgi:hypothetical protein
MMFSDSDSVCRITVLLEREMVLKAAPQFCAFPWVLQAIMYIHWYEDLYFSIANTRPQKKLKGTSLNAISKYVVHIHSYVSVFILSRF